MPTPGLLNQKPGEEAAEFYLALPLVIQIHVTGRQLPADLTKSTFILLLSSDFVKQAELGSVPYFKNEETEAQIT